MGYWVVGQTDIGHPLIVSSLGGAFMDIAQLLTFSVKQGASDLHLSAGVEPMIRVDGDVKRINLPRSEEHTSELQSLMRISYAVFCLKKKKNNKSHNKIRPTT